jgi:hypothetical protein
MQSLPPLPEITSMIQASISGDLSKVQEDLDSYLKLHQNAKLYELDTVLN